MLRDDYEKTIKLFENNNNDDNYMTLPEDCYPCHTMIGDRELEEKLDKFLIMN